MTLPKRTRICFDDRLRRSATPRQQQTPHAQGEASAAYLLHAWCDEAGLGLGQNRTPGKATEVTAMPDLLVLLDVQDCLLTIDAIVGTEAEYLLTLKGNQPGLHAAVKAAFVAAAPPRSLPRSAKNLPTGG